MFDVCPSSVGPSEEAGIEEEEEEQGVEEEGLEVEEEEDEATADPFLSPSIISSNPILSQAPTRSFPPASPGPNIISNAISTSAFASSFPILACPDGRLGAERRATR